MTDAEKLREALDVGLRDAGKHECPDAAWVLRAVVDELGLTWEHAEEPEGSWCRCEECQRKRAIATLLEAAGFER